MREDEGAAELVKDDEEEPCSLARTVMEDGERDEQVNNGLGCLLFHMNTLGETQVSGVSSDRRSHSRLTPHSPFRHIPSVHKLLRTFAILLSRRIT